MTMINPGLMARIHANEDLVRSVERIAEEGGLDAAVVRPSIGSLIGARLGVGDITHEAPGPCVEVVSLVGQVQRGSDGHYHAELSAVVVDTNGRVYAGRVLPDVNPVALTFEVALEAWRPGTEA